MSRASGDAAAAREAAAGGPDPLPGLARRPAGSGKPPIAFYWWPLWLFLLALCLLFFYGVLTPVWMGIRLVASLTERGRRQRGRQPLPGPEAVPSPGSSGGSSQS